MSLDARDNGIDAVIDALNMIRRARARRRDGGRVPSQPAFREKARDARAWCGARAGGGAAAVGRVLARAPREVVTRHASRGRSITATGRRCVQRHGISS
jgi:hypothetical protein